MDTGHGLGDVTGQIVEYTFESLDQVSGQAHF